MQLLEGKQRDLSFRDQKVVNVNALSLPACLAGFDDYAAVPATYERNNIFI